MYDTQNQLKHWLMTRWRLVVVTVCSILFILYFVHRQSGVYEIKLGSHKSSEPKPRMSHAGMHVLKADFDNPSMREDLLESYWKLVTGEQTLCQNKIRLGPLGDTGYDMCEDPPYRPQQPCLVYSFGSRFLFGFEEGIIKNYNCEVHTFDPSLAIKGHHIPPKVNFHLLGLAERDYTNDLGWNLQRLESIWKSLGHEGRIIDVLKIDVEGFEWVALPDIIRSGMHKYVKQLLVEVHFGLQVDKATGFKTFRDNTWGYVPTEQQLQTMRSLGEEGFKSYSYELNDVTFIKFKEPYGRISTCSVLSYINVIFQRLKQ